MSDDAKKAHKAAVEQWRAAHPLETQINRLRNPLAQFGMKVERGMIGRTHPVAGAKAELFDGTSSRHTLTRMVTVAGALTKKKTGKGTLTVVCTDGAVLRGSIPAGATMSRAASWVAAFNAYSEQLSAEQTGNESQPPSPADA